MTTSKSDPAAPPDTPAGVDAAHLESAARSAAVVVPLLLEMVPSIGSVVDVGCESGAWLHEFQLNGVAKVLGLDRAEIPSFLLQIEPDEFLRVDVSLPLPALGQFDLALALDIADCLTEQAAPQFVSGLASLSDLVVFSATAPGQASPPMPNERWPSYWIGLFAANGFAAFDAVRGRLWYDQRVEWRHAQNMLVFARRSRPDLLKRLAAAAKRAARPLDVVHPRAFEHFRSETPHDSYADVMLYPFRLVESGFEGYNILQIAPHRFLGLAQSEGAYFPAKLAAGRYELAHVGASVDDVKAKVSQRLSAVGSADGAGGAPSRPSAQIVLIEDGYRGYNILRVDDGRFVALHQSEGAFSAEKLAAGGYRRVHEAATAEAVKTKVRRTPFPVKVLERDFKGYSILQIDEQTFLALARSEGPYSAETLAAGEYERAYVGESAERVRAQCRRPARR